MSDAENKNKDDYSEDSWNAYQEALEEAKKVSEKADATPEEIKAAYDKLQNATDALKNKSDKVTLNEQIGEAANKDENDYSSESWAAYQEALAEAKKIANKVDATPEEIKAAYDKLQAAEDALAIKPTKSMLNEQLIQAGNKIPGVYTQESWAAFQEAVLNAKAVLLNANATPNEVEAAYNALKAAMQNLVLNSDAPSDDNTGDDNIGEDNIGDDNTGDGNIGDDNTGDDSADDDNIDGDNADDDNTDDDNTDDETTDDEEETEAKFIVKGGCKLSIATSAFVIVGIMGMAFLKKKED